MPNCRSGLRSTAVVYWSAGPVHQAVASSELPPPPHLHVVLLEGVRGVPPKRAGEVLGGDRPRRELQLWEGQQGVGSVVGNSNSHSMYNGTTRN